MTLTIEKERRESGRIHESMAVAALIQTRKLAPDSAEVNREMGVTFSKQGRPDVAAASLREAVQLAPNDPEAWSNLGGALEESVCLEPPRAMTRRRYLNRATVITEHTN